MQVCVPTVDPAAFLKVMALDSPLPLVVLMIAALYGTGIRPRDRFFCPSSPAWGHGLWHGTLAPLALGVETGVYAGRFDAERC